MDAIFEMIMNFELELVSCEGRRSTARLAALLHDEFEEVGKSGRVYGKVDTLALLPEERYQVIELRAFRFRRLADDTVLVKYLSESQGVVARRSSVWVWSEAGWQLLYHQGTAVVRAATERLKAVG